MLEQELQAAKRIARSTWDLIAPLYDGEMAFERKEDGAPITAADTIANAHIVEELSRLFPADSIITEEGEAVLNGDRTWYVDPVDGTRGFYKRNAQFAIQIGLCAEEHPVMGVVFWPATGDLYSGIIGQGACRENSRGTRELHTSDSDYSRLAAIIAGHKTDKPVSALLTRLGVVQYYALGSEGLRLMKIPENRADVRVVESRMGPSTWDLCAPHAIVEAAGGVMQCFDGPISYRRQGRLGKYYFAARNRPLAERVLGLGAALSR